MDDSSLRQLMMTSQTSEEVTKEESTTGGASGVMVPMDAEKVCTKEASHAVAVAAVAAVLSHGMVPLVENQQPPSPPPLEDIQEEKQPLNGEEHQFVKKVVEPTWKVVRIWALQGPCWHLGDLPDAIMFRGTTRIRKAALASPTLKHSLHCIFIASSFFLGLAHRSSTLGSTDPLPHLHIHWRRCFHSLGRAACT